MTYSKKITNLKFIITYVKIKYIKNFIYCFFILSNFVATGYVSAKSNDEPVENNNELVFAPNSNPKSLYPVFSNSLDLSFLYGSNLNSVYKKINSVVFALEINPFYNKSPFDIFGFLRSSAIRIDYSKIKLLNSNYSSVINNYQINALYKAINTPFIAVYIGSGVGLLVENTLFINNKEEVEKINQTLNTYSVSLGANIWLKPLGNIKIFSFFSIADYLENSYFYIEAKQYNLSQKATKKYIDTYRYEIYNVGIRYNFPLIKRFKVKTL